MTPKLNKGEYVFVSVQNLNTIKVEDIICSFRESEGISIIIEKTKADKLNLSYDFIASWITLTVHSSLDAVGLTAVFSSELAKYGISCNVVAGFYHDHIFVNHKDSKNALETLLKLSKKNKEN
jgi:uncharacterized protein